MVISGGTNKQFSLWKHVVTKDITFWLCCHPCTHVHFTQCSTMSWPMCNLEHKSAWITWRTLWLTVSL